MKKALIIEDDPVSRQVISELLMKIDFNVEVAEDGYDGVRKANKLNYDLICLDVRMPGVDGEQVMSIMNRNKKGDSSNLPVVVVSGYLTKNNVMKLQSLGVKSFVTKPVDIQKFYAAVNQACSLN